MAHNYGFYDLSRKCHNYFINIIYPSKSLQETAQIWVELFNLEKTENLKNENPTNENFAVLDMKNLCLTALTSTVSKVALDAALGDVFERHPSLLRAIYLFDTTTKIEPRAVLTRSKNRKTLFTEDGDVKFSIGIFFEISVHSPILSRCPYYRTFFEGGWREGGVKNYVLDEKDYTPRGLTELFRVIYCSELSLDSVDMALDFVGLAKAILCGNDLELKIFAEAQDRVENFLIREFYNAKTLLPYLERIKMLELSKVYTRCLQILKKESKLGSLLKIHVTNTEILYDVFRYCDNQN